MRIMKIFQTCLLILLSLGIIHIAIFRPYLLNSEDKKGIETEKPETLVNFRAAVHLSHAKHGMGHALNNESKRTNHFLVRNAIFPNELWINRVAFLFLTVDEFPVAEIWDCWLEEYKEKVAMWMSHKNKCPSFCARKSLCSCVRAKSSWAYLRPVYLELFREALGDPSKEYFILISDSTIPLKSFAYVINEVNHLNTSVICPAGISLKENEQRHLKHHQWIILTREHANKIFLGLKRLLNRDVFGRRKIFDEYVVGVYILGPVPNKIISASEIEAWAAASGVSYGCRTFVRWAGGVDFLPIPSNFDQKPGHPYHFFNISTEDLDALLSQPEYLFGRKFGNETQVDQQPLKDALGNAFGWKHCK